MELKKQRQSNIELFRIVTMLLIVAHHYVVNSGLLIPIEADLTSGRSLFYLIFGAWGKTGIDCFVMITGYFMCTSDITLRKFLRLVLEIIFYNYAIWIILWVFGKADFSIGRAISCIIPIKSLSDNFTGCFLVFYLLIPFLNSAIHAMTQKQHLCLVAILVFFYSVFPTIPMMSVIFNYVTWFVVLFFVGSYLRLYPISWLEKKAGLCLLISFIAAIVSILFLAHTSLANTGGFYATYYFVSDSNKPLALLISLFGFLFFKKLQIGYHKWINDVGATTFGVLLIHANCSEMRSWLWGSLLHNQEMYGSNL